MQENVIFEKKDRKYDTNRRQYLLGNKLLKKCSGKHALDLGCGVGEFTDMLAKAGYETKSVDGLPEFVEALKARGLEAKQCNLENDRLPYSDNSFDLVASLDVIEHLWNTEFYLSEISRVLRPGGFYIVTTPNYNYVKYRLKHVFGNFEHFTFGSRHKKFYTVKSFEKEIAEGFSIVEHIGSLPGTSKHGKFVKNWRLKNLFSVQTGILAQKPE
jgi:2-polyprenyl-3-methyl-5-hydroxy-6-metoxy-1,4-benzoquinol methylase